MKSLSSTILALAACLSAVQGDFSLATCKNGMASSPIVTEVASLTTDGGWQCQQFSVDRNSGNLLRLEVPEQLNGKTVQVALYNAKRTAASTTSSNWRPSGSAPGFAKMYKPLNTPNDVNGLQTSWNQERFGAAPAFALAQTRGLVNDGTADIDTVYAYRGAMTVNTGPNTIIIENPDEDSSNAKTFEGSLLYRIVDAKFGVLSPNTFNGGAGSQIKDQKLTVGSSVTVGGLLMPGDEMYLPIDEEFAKYGIAIRGLKYSIKTTPSSFMDASPFWDSAGLPMGFQTTPGLEDSTVGAVSSRLSTTDNQPLLYNYTDSATWTSSAGTTTVSASSVTREWKYPIDFLYDTPFRGMLKVQVPPLTSFSSAKTWSTSTPFVSVTVTLNSATEYPLLSELSNLELRNYDATSSGHSVADIRGNTPFEIYRLKVTDERLVLGGVTFGAVSNLNKPAGQQASTAVPLACQPRIELQPVSSGSSVFRNGWSPVDQVGGGWFALSDIAGSSLSMPLFARDADGLVAPSTLSDDAYANQVGYETGNDWHSVATNTVPLAGSALGPYQSTDEWFLIRISAAKRDLIGDPTRRTSTCGSNNVKISRAMFSSVGVSGQCQSYDDCAVGADSNPNKAQASDSANNDAARFSTCVLMRSVGPNYRALPTSKCVECMSDDHCQGGQYCHLDDGICDSAGNNGKYLCDAESNKMYGICRAKSPDVLGKQCRNTYTSDTNGFTAMAVIGADAQAYSTVNVPAAALGPSAITSGLSAGIATGGDAKDDKMAKGANGACGEFRYGSGSDPAPNAAPGSSGIRAALWSGYCNQDRTCMECVPGTRYSSTGKVCLNGKTFTAMDVDGTVRTYAQNTMAGSILGTTCMVILLAFMWAAYMFSEAKRARHQMGLPPMTWCECLFCCCGTWSEKYKVPATDTKNPLA